MSVLRVGSRGPEVVRLQQMLVDVGCLPSTSSVDGIFGPGTESAVRNFQRSAGLVVDGVVGPATWSALGDASNKIEERPPPEPLPCAMRAIREAGHEVYWRGDYHLSLFGVRSAARVANRFDDVLGAAYTVDGRWVVETFAGTTDPGTYWLENPSRVKGTAILVPGQYRDAWRIDLHAGKYPALCQRSGPVRVYRDRNRDDVLDFDPSSIVEGSFGINIHRSRAGGESESVDRWSAGCQVFKRSADFDRVMALARQQVDRTGIETFTYTLVDERG